MNAPYSKSINDVKPILSTNKVDSRQFKNKIRNLNMYVEHKLMILYE